MEKCSNHGNKLPCNDCSFERGYADAIRDFDYIESGLKKIQEVLNYVMDNRGRYNLLIWIKESIDTILRGDKVEMPPRDSTMKTKIKDDPDYEYNVTLDVGLGINDLQEAIKFIEEFRDLYRKYEERYYQRRFNVGAGPGVSTAGAVNIVKTDYESEEKIIANIDVDELMSDDYAWQDLKED